MNTSTFRYSLLVTAILLTAEVQADASDTIRINGFASIVGGMTTNEGTARNININTNPISSAEAPATYRADGVTEGIYDDKLSFKPDTNFGLQLSADLSQNLSVTGQITGNGGEDFDANISWAYLTYQINGNLTLQAGRQRLPMYFYSDFIDVGYAYHWIRPPQDLAVPVMDTFEGVKLSWNTSIDNLDWAVDAYLGSGSEDLGEDLGDGDFDNIYGFAVKTSNPWLQLRASYVQSDTLIGDGRFSRNGVTQGTNQTPVTFKFYGLAAHINIDNVFVVSEYTYSDTNEPFGPDSGLFGFVDDEGWYISTGIRLENFTPHITYGERITTYEQTGFSSTEAIREYWIIGTRWDFHPSAAAKIEYLVRSDKSDAFYKNAFGPLGTGTADSFEVDHISFGIDLIF